MKVKLQKTLSAINQAAGVVTAANFSWQVISGVIHWYHNNQLHHSITLSDEQHRHFQNGGTLECEYACGTTLRARQG